jgi:hypothetical protein
MALMVHYMQAVYSGNKAGDDLFLAVSEIKASVRRGLTLVDVYGSYSTLAKVATLVMRKNINAKYDKVCGMAVRPSVHAGAHGSRHCVT